MPLRKYGNYYKYGTIGGTDYVQPTVYCNDTANLWLLGSLDMRQLLIAQ